MIRFKDTNYLQDTRDPGSCMHKTKDLVQNKRQDNLLETLAYRGSIENADVAAIPHFQLGLLSGIAVDPRRYAILFQEELNPHLFFKQIIDKQNTTYNQTNANNTRYSQ